MKTIEQLEKEAKQAREEAEKACEGVDPKILDLIGKVIHAAFLQYTIGMMQQRGLNDGRVAKELFGDGSGESLPEVSQEERDSDGWIVWGGGKCPVKETEIVEVKFRLVTMRNYIVGAGIFRWNHADKSGVVDGDPQTDIIAYRIVKGE